MNDLSASRSEVKAYPDRFRISLCPSVVHAFHHKKFKRVSPAPAVDAQLDIGINFVGYAAAGSGKGQPYRPTMLVSVRLLDASGKQVLYQDQILHHNVLNNTTAVVIEPDTRYSYPNFKDMKRADAAAIEGLRDAVNKVAIALAQQLK